MFDDSGPRVDLRGASKKQDRRALLARAQREREERELQRKRAREALRLQTCYRAHLDLGRARAAARASFDSEMARLCAESGRPHQGAPLLPVQPAGGGAQLLAQLLQSAAADEADANACAMCATEDGARAGSTSRAGSSSCASPGCSPRSSRTASSCRLCCTSPTRRWHWRPRLTPARATHVEMLAHRSQLELGSRSVHAAVAVALGALLPPLTRETVVAPPAPASPASLLLGPLLAVSMRQLFVACGAAGRRRGRPGQRGAQPALRTGLLCRLPRGAQVRVRARARVRVRVRVMVRMR